MHHIYIAVIFLMANIARTANETIRSELLALGLSSGSHVAPPSDFTQRWSSYDAPSYVTAVRPANDDDVAKIVKILF